MGSGWTRDPRPARSARRAAALRFLLPLALTIAGIAVIVADGPRSLVGWMLVGLGVVLATSLLFLEAGLSEDRERYREASKRTRRPPRHSNS